MNQKYKTLLRLKKIFSKISNIYLIDNKIVVEVKNLALIPYILNYIKNEETLVELWNNKNELIKTKFFDVVTSKLILTVCQLDKRSDIDFYIKGMTKIVNAKIFYQKDCKDIILQQECGKVSV